MGCKEENEIKRKRRDLRVSRDIRVKEDKKVRK